MDTEQNIAAMDTTQHNTDPNTQPIDPVTTETPAEDGEEVNNDDVPELEDDDKGDSSDSGDDVDIYEFMSLEEKLKKATELKEEGNTFFKTKSNEDAATKYREGLDVLKKSKQETDAKPLLLSLNLNLAAALIKTETWSEVLKHANQALEFDKENLKALYRRGVARFRSGELQAAKEDLLFVAKADGKNKNARKELEAVKKALVEFKQNQKRKFQNMFASSMYSDKEEERKQKEFQEEENKRRKAEEDRLEEERIKQAYSDDCTAREMKAEKTITFEEFKKQEKKRKEDAEKKVKEEKEAEEKRMQSLKDEERQRALAERNKHDVVQVDDEEDLKHVKGYKQKSDGRTTSYFDKELSEEDKKLIGNITPQKIEQPSSPQKIEKVGSAWNKAGTWEEKDKSTWCRDRLKEMVGGVTATVGGADAMKDTDKLMQAFSGLGGGGGLGGDGGDPMASLSKAMSFLYKVDIKVKDVKKVEGDASIVFASGKKSCLFDLTMELSWAASLDESGGLPPMDYMKDEKDDNKISKYNGTLIYKDICSTMDIKSVEVTNKFKKTPAEKHRQALNDAVENLKTNIFKQFEVFIQDFAQQ